MVVKMEYVDGGADTFGVCIFCMILWILHRVTRDYLSEHITEGSGLASLNTIRSIIVSVNTIQRINHEIVIRRCENTFRNRCKDDAIDIITGLKIQFCRQRPIHSIQHVPNKPYIYFIQNKKVNSYKFFPIL